MSADKPFTKENLDSYLKELAKEFRKKNGTRMPAEIILIGLLGTGLRAHFRAPYVINIVLLYGLLDLHL